MFHAGGPSPPFASRQCCLITAAEPFVPQSAIETAANLFARASVIGEYMSGRLDEPTYRRQLRELVALYGQIELKHMAQGK